MSYVRSTEYRVRSTYEITDGVAGDVLVSNWHRRSSLAGKVHRPRAYHEPYPFFPYDFAVQSQTWPTLESLRRRNMLPPKPEKSLAATRLRCCSPGTRLRALNKPRARLKTRTLPTWRKDSKKTATKMDEPGSRPQWRRSALLGERGGGTAWLLGHGEPELGTPVTIQCTPTSKPCHALSGRVPAASRLVWLLCKAPNRGTSADIPPACGGRRSCF